MADSALSNDPLERYSAIEKAYCDERWQTVIQDGQTLLAALPRSGQAPEGLQERLQLLMAHAYLYGFADRDNAEDLYQAVLRSGGEASLRQIAEQGLQECTRPVAASRPPEEEWQPQQAEEPQLVSPSSSVAVPESPAAPVPAAPSDAHAEPDVQSSWLAPELTEVSPAEAPRAAASSPVMPWLASAPVAAAATAPAVEDPFAKPSEPAAPVPASTAAASPTSSEIATSAWSEDLTSPSALVVEDLDVAVAAAPLEQESEPPAEPADPGASWQGGGAVLASATLAAAAVAPESAESAFTGIPPAPGDITAEPVPIVDAAWEAPLVPEVIEEPELLEVHQADPLRAEEFEVRVRESLPAAEMATIPDGPEAIEAAEDMATTRLTLAKSETEELQDLTVDLEDPSLQPEGRGEPPSWDQQAADPSVRIGLIGLGPFSAPPEPVDEEDPELLMCLLRVEMG